MKEGLRAEAPHEMSEAVNLQGGRKHTYTRAPHTWATEHQILSN